jgi:hypothetical protein
MNSQDIFLLKISEAQPGDILVIRSDDMAPAVAQSIKDHILKVSGKDISILVLGKE